MITRETYRGRLAPSPTGYLHLGHARTFWVAQQRALASGGTLILRNDDLDQARCRPEFVSGMFEDLRWLGFSWSEGPDVGGPHAPYSQSERVPFYASAFDVLRKSGLIYPCLCSRQDVLRALSAPHEAQNEPLYPGTCRFRSGDIPRAGVNWRFRVSDGETVRFVDSHYGVQSQVAGEDFGDFLVWRKDDLPSYQLATVVDDAALGITEAVRGADLITSTFRQLLLYRGLGLAAPAFHHCALVTDESGTRLAKRNAAMSLRALRASGARPESLRLPDLQT